MGEGMRSLLLSLALITAAAHAQVWCPPGAEWTFDYQDILGDQYGVVRVNYVGDTLLGGEQAQMLQETVVTAPWGQQTYATTTYPPFMTRYADGVVYAWDGWNAAYDTLMWFGAVPGQHWSAFTDSWSGVVVTDTATVMIDGTPLRRLAVMYYPGGSEPLDTLYERIGFELLYITGWTWFVTDMPYGPLRCYRDDSFSYVAPGILDCGYTLTTQEIAHSTDLVASPNPGSDHFTLSLSSGTHTITLLDATGRIALLERTSDERAWINTTHLPSGIYVVRVDEGLEPMRWVKQ